MRILVDTNVLVRTVERNHPMRRISRDALRHLYERGDELCIAPQNVSEFWTVCTRSISANGLGQSIVAAARIVTRMTSLFTILPESLEAFQHWRQLVVADAVTGARVHDARLAAIVLAYRLDAILTFNGSDFKRFPITVLDPAQI